MDHTAKKNAEGNYEVSDKSGVRIATGTKDILGNYGLSESNLGGMAAPVNEPSVSAPVTTKEELPGIGVITKVPKVALGSGTTPIVDNPLGDNTAGLYERTGVTPPPSYTVKQGDTLSAIAARSGMTLVQLTALNPDIKDPNKIGIGQSINLGGGIKKAPGGDLAGKVPEGWDATTYANFKTANPGKEPTDEDTAKMLGLPTYPKVKSPQVGITEAYNSLKTSIDDIEKRIRSNAVPTDQEKELAKLLTDKKAQLANFDVDVEKRVNDLYGQGRGATLSTIGLQDTQERRSSALERLGLATEANTLVSQLGLAQDERKAQGELATTDFNLAAKKLDIALGLHNEIEKLNDDDKADARQYLLDVVSFGAGKTYEQLDKNTQSAITKAVANSPITLDMVKTALSSAAEKAAAQAKGDIRTVTGVGVVMINPDGKGYKVIVPENPTPTTKDVPSFDKWFEDQKVPLANATPEVVAKYKEEYNSLYGSPDVNLGKLTSTQKGTLSQAGLSNSPTPVQSFFLNTPSEFQDEYNRNMASGKGLKNPGITQMTDAYTTWFKAQEAKKKSSGARDWSALLGTTTPAKK